MWHTRLLDQTLQLGPNQEHDFGPIQYYPNQKLILSSSGTVRHYLGLYDEPVYRQHRSFGGRFPFAFGSDRNGHILDFQTVGTGRLFVVVRVGIFNPAGTVRVILEV